MQGLRLAWGRCADKPLRIKEDPAIMKGNRTVARDYRDKRPLPVDIPVTLAIEPVPLLQWAGRGRAWYDPDGHPVTRRNRGAGIYGERESHDHKCWAHSSMLMRPPQNRHWNFRPRQGVRIMRGL